MVADVPFIGADAGAVGEGLRLFVVAGIVGDDGDALALEREADRLPDAAAAAGDDCDACHENSPTQIVRPDYDAPRRPASCQIGRAPCRERMCQYVTIYVVAGKLQKKRSKQY